MDTIEALTSIPSFARPTAIPEEGLVAYWWSEDKDTTLRSHDPETGGTERIPVKGFEPRGHEPLIWTGDAFVVSTRPETYLVERGGSTEEILPEDEYTLVHNLSPDGRFVLYTHYEEIHAETWPLKLYDREQETTQVLTDHPQQSGHAGFSPDGEWIAFRENPEDRFHEGRQVVTTRDGERESTFTIANSEYRAQQHGWHPADNRMLVADRSTGMYRVGLYDWQTDEETWFGPGEYNERPQMITADGETIVAARQRDGAKVPVVYSVNEGTGQELNLDEGVLNSAIRYQEDEVILAHETSTTPARLLTYNLVTDETEALIDTRTEALSELDLAASKQVTYESTDGLAVNAILYRTGKSLSPAVVYVHGGPTSAEHRDFDSFAQFLVNNDYTVLQPNYRGSTDQDRAFEEAIRGDVGGGEVEDVAEGGRWLADQPWIDEDQMAAMGHSHGAYNASMVAARFSDLWQLVCIKNGYLEHGVENPNPYARRRMIADRERESKEEFLRERSAIKRADEIECPVCLIYGGDDHVEAAERLVDALEERDWTEGKEFRFEIIEGEGHVIQDKERLWTLIAENLEEYMQD